MNRLPDVFRYKLPFVIAGFVSMLLSLYLYFIEDDATAAIFVGLWVPSIHSLGSLLLSSDPAHADSTPTSASVGQEVRS